MEVLASNLFSGVTNGAAQNVPLVTSQAKCLNIFFEGKALEHLD